MPYVYENCKALYNVRHCHCPFSCKFCYEIDPFLCKVITRERDRQYEFFGYAEQVFDDNNDQICKKSIF